MLDDAFVFSSGQLITVSAASNYPNTGFGTAGAGVFDLGAVVPSPGGAGGYGARGVLGGSLSTYLLSVYVFQIFQGPANAGLTVFLQDSADNINWFNTDLGDYLLEPLSVLTIPGARLIQTQLPSISGSVNPPGPLQRYIRMYYSVTNGPFTAGAVNANVDVL